MGVSKVWVYFKKPLEKFERSFRSQNAMKKHCHERLYKQASGL